MVRVNRALARNSEGSRRTARPTATGRMESIRPPMWTLNRFMGPPLYQHAFGLGSLFIGLDHPGQLWSTHSLPCIVPRPSVRQL